MPSDEQCDKEFDQLLSEISDHLRQRRVIFVDRKASAAQIERRLATKPIRIDLEARIVEFPDGRLEGFAPSGAPPTPE